MPSSVEVIEALGCAKFFHPTEKKTAKESSVSTVVKEGGGFKPSNCVSSETIPQWLRFVGVDFFLLLFCHSF